MIKIGFIYGGRSTEHDASIKSYENVRMELEHDDFVISDVAYIDRCGNVSLNASSVSHGAFIDYVKNNNDIFWINLLHGQEGEDGAWSGIYEVIDGKGSFENILTSSLIMDKYIQSCFATKILEQQLLMPVSSIVSRADLSNIDIILRKYDGLTDKIIVKPNSMGASHLTETFHTKDKTKIINHINQILAYDSEALIQQFISGDEYTCGVFNNCGKIELLPVIKVTSTRDILGHKEKHHNGLLEVLFISNEFTEKIKNIVEVLFYEFRIKGMVRFDFIVKDDQIYYLEGNLIPGFSKSSAFPMMLKEAGITIAGFFKAIIPNYMCEKRNKYLPYEID